MLRKMVANCKLEIWEQTFEVFGKRVKVTYPKLVVRYSHDIHCNSSRYRPRWSPGSGCSCKK